MLILAKFKFEVAVHRNDNLTSTSIFLKDVIPGVKVNIESDAFKNNKSMIKYLYSN